jgi:hypothetical protein
MGEAIWSRGNVGLLHAVRLARLVRERCVTPGARRSRSSERGTMDWRQIDALHGARSARFLRSGGLACSVL